MIRKYNYTGRKKILAQKIQIKECVKDNKKSFEAEFDFQGLGFPDEAKIYIEPYFKSSFIRFDFGSIARREYPNTDIDNLPTTERLHYRIKIVDNTSVNGLILGYADIQGDINNSLGSRKAILPVDFIELGHRIWTLEFRSAGPVLAVNANIPNIKESVKVDDIFFSLVYPEVIKRIAFEVAKDNEGEVSDWQNDWINFFTQILMQPPPPDDSENAEDWSNEISDAFARKYKITQRYQEKV